MSTLSSPPPSSSRPPRILDSAGGPPSPTLRGSMPATSTYRHPTDSVYHDGDFEGMASVQFGLVPATQQTTVVTTTTTTVNLAPFVLKAPASLAEKDPRRFPLAGNSTPHHMRNFNFTIGGRSMTFEEADRTDEFIGKYQLRQRALRIAGGSLTHETQSSADQDSPATNFKLDRSRQQIPDASLAPPSLIEAVRLVGDPQGSIGSDLRPSRRSSREAEQTNLRSRRRLEPSVLPNATSDTMTTGLGHAVPGQLRRHLQPPPLFHERSDSPAKEALRTSQRHNDAMNTSNTDHVGYDRPRRAHDRSSASGGPAAATPPIMESDVEAEDLLSHPMPITASGLAINTATQDASLPSPSLSPITAAANFAQRRTRDLENLARFENEDVSDLSTLEGDDAPPRESSSILRTSRVTGTKNMKMVHEGRQSATERTAPSRTLMDVPQMIDMFDSIPAELQSYVMYQLLRRSSKAVLRTVAEVVNPALKCDPFDVLPAELSLKITKLLDGQSMGRAAQVSRRWRELINSDETAWRELIDREGYTLGEEELKRAIREGWGWQYPGRHEAELDLSTKPQMRALTIPDGLLADNDEGSHDLRTSRKRKSIPSSSSNKRQKRKVPVISAAPHQDELKWLPDLQKAQGPLSFASAAARAVPNPKFGLASLKGLHLFKSIYARHRLMRQAWMEGHVQPRHLAFRAHHRHVVTCLLFDSDRIITGSDDTSINVFDTKTGILRRCLQGHEGGVWALSCDGNILVSGSTDRSVRVWDIDDGSCLQTLHGHTSTVRCLVVLKPTQIGTDEHGLPIIAPKEPTIITGSRDSTLRVWKLPPPDAIQVHQTGPPDNDAEKPYSLRTLIGHTNSVRAIAAYGDTLVSGSYDCTVRVWQISTGALLQRLQGHTQKVYSVVLDYERERCVSGSMDNMVKVWSLETGSCLYNLEGHTSLVGLLELDYGHLVSAAADSTLRVWDPEHGTCKNILEAHTGAITCFQHDAQKVVSGSDRTLKMWNIQTGECVRDLLTDLSGVWQVRFDERRCVAAVQRNGLTYIEVLDFSASRDGVPAADRGRRIVVDRNGREIDDEEVIAAEQAEHLALAPQQAV